MIPAIFTLIGLRPSIDTEQLNTSLRDPAPIVRKIEQPSWTESTLPSGLRELFALNVGSSSNSLKFSDDQIDVGKALSQKFTVIERKLDVVDGQRASTSVSELLKKEGTKAVILVAVGKGCPHADHNEKFIDASGTVLDAKGIKIIAVYNASEATTKKFFDRYQSPLAVVADPTCRTQFTSGLPASNSFVAFTKEGLVTVSVPGLSSTEVLAKGAYPFIEKSLGKVLQNILGNEEGNKSLEEIRKKQKGPTDFELGCPLVPENR